MTTLSLLSKFLLSITFAAGGVVASSDAAPANDARAAHAERRNTVVQAKRGTPHQPAKPVKRGPNARAASRAKLVTEARIAGKGKPVRTGAPTPRIQRPFFIKAQGRPMRVAQASPPAPEASPSAANDQKPRMHQRRARLKARFDSNKDGKLDESERLVMKKAIFAKLDANNDGKITIEEIRAAKRERRAKRAMGSGKGPKAHKGKNKGKHGEGRFARLDSNKDGTISWKEFSAAKGKGMWRGRHGRGQGKARY